MAGKGRMRGVVEEPDGLTYHPEVLSAAEEHEVLAALDRLEYDQVLMRGQAARRTVHHFGYRYDYASSGLVPAPVLPDALEFVRERCAALAGLPPAALAEALVNRYPPGATIGWHRDAPIFGPTLAGVSLGAPCLLRFQRPESDERRVYEVALAPRSAYVLTGPARALWQHSIPAVPELRYSITFRTVRA